MKQTVSLYAFRDAFQRVRPENFSYEGLEVLFDYLEEYEESTGTELELDVIALCCDWSECTVEELANDYSLDEEIEGWAELDEDEKEEATQEWLQDQTMVAGLTSSGAFVFCSSF